jgi:hypothetical protein
LRLRINKRPEVPLDVRLHGPGDVIGVDPRAIIRTEPRHLASDVEPNLFVAIDFDLPDFPWLFTPSAVAADAPPGAQRLRPWLCLIVVTRDFATLAADPARPLPALRCPRSELPDLEESWAWAHAQVTGSADEAAVGTALAGSSDLTASRLLCPRRLQPRTAYLACLVPAYRAGVEAGLGLAVTSDAVRPAWSSADAGAAAEIELPVYYQWSFTTGSQADFESLARLLKGMALPDDVGLRPLGVRAPGLGLPAAGDVVGLEGALRAPTMRPTEWPDAQGRRFQDSLREMLNRAEASLAAPAAPAEGETPEPLVAPPIYGRWHAAHRLLDESSPPWLGELNLDPRHRAAAGAGALVVQTHQEQLMASAWEQFGEIARANQLLRQAQLARAVGQVTFEKRLAGLTSGLLLQATAPAHSRVLVDGSTVRSRVRRSVLPEASLSGAFRRVTRPRGPIARRLLPPTERRARPLVQRLAVGEIRPAAGVDAPRGTVSIDAVSEAVAAVPGRPAAATLLRFADATPEALRAALGRAGRPAPRPTVPPRRGGVGGRGAPAPTRLGAAAIAQQSHLMESLTIDAPPPLPDLALEDVRGSLLRALDPAVTVTRRIRLRVRPPAPVIWERPDPLAPLVVQPVFRQPMLEPLAEIDPDFVLPGLQRVPTNVATLVEANPRFIEAYMAGLNHEMSGELLWREFPTDQRGTYFRRFWDVAAGSDEGDIPPVSSWSRGLGKNMTGATADALLVLLIRGELLRRYPGTLVYALAAEWVEGGRRPGTRELQPLFRGGLDPDLVFVGFTLTVHEARGGDPPSGSAGWYFVLQEQPTEPRFGLDLEAAGALASWADLAWTHVAQTPSGYLSVAGTPPETAAVVDPGGASWGLNGAHMAVITLQRPMRVAIHARTMLAEGAP